jgi:uncharacterized Fe-S cluster-containing MiaB family protein
MLEHKSSRRAHKERFHMTSPSDQNQDVYTGFEQGPIRPPSEAYSLLIRVTRNCPWNRCTFCPVYKGSRFSLRPVEHVIKDIDAVYHHTTQLRERSDPSEKMLKSALRRGTTIAPQDYQAFQAALNWYTGGMTSVFLQDANSLVIKPRDLITILSHLKARFPWIERVTSYARSHTIARIKDEDLTAMRQAGLNRIHIGLESGSDKVLKQVKKGATKAMHIKAGRKVKRAGMELSEYVMPGLGGKALSQEHATETADALNQIDADFIRLRTLAIPNGIPLYDEVISGEFQKCSDKQMAQEIGWLIESLDGITSMIKSDHILNLFQEIEGRMPEDREAMLAVIRQFLAMDSMDQCRYQVGRRLGLFSGISDMASARRMARVESVIEQVGITPENVDATIDQLMQRFI